jgi:hypothetical protein
MYDFENGGNFALIPGKMTSPTEENKSLIPIRENYII